MAISVRSLVFVLRMIKDSAIVNIQGKRRVWFAAITLLFISIPLAWPKLAFAAPVVNETIAELLARNECRQFPISANDQAQLFQQGWKEYATIDSGPTGSAGGGFLCPPGAQITQLLEYKSGVMYWIIEAIAGIIVGIASLGTWVSAVGGQFVAVMLQAGKFVTHPFVTGGWVFVLGFANLGFILTLLFIAAATTLRLNVGGGTRRLLPRLLIAALLINFSLVVGGLLIDIARLVMVIVSNSLSQDVEQLGFQILSKSDLITTGFQQLSFIQVGTGQNFLLENGVPYTNWKAVILLLQSTLLVWGIAIAMWVVAVGLFTRYIMLLLLLIASPFAYLASAMPGLTELGRKWWQQFIKWVLFGPIAMFILVLLTKINAQTADDLGGSILAGAIVSTLLTMGLLVGAYFAAKSLGAAGSGFALSIASGAATRARQWGKAGAKGAVTAAYVGTGTRAVTRQTRDAAREFTKPIRRAFRMGEFSKYDKKGKLKKGEESVGSKLGKKASGAAGAVAGAAAGAVLGGPAGAVAGGVAGYKLIGRKERADARKQAEQTKAAKQVGNSSYQSQLGAAIRVGAAGNTVGAEQGIVSALRQSGRADMKDVGAQAEKLLNPNFTLNLPPSLLAGILRYGPDSHKKAATAALTTADRTLANQKPAKQAIEKIIETGVQLGPQKGGTELIKPLAGNINLAANISETYVGRIVAMGDEKLTTQVLKSRKAAKDRKDKEAKEGKE